MGVITITGAGDAGEPPEEPEDDEVDNKAVDFLVRTLRIPSLKLTEADLLNIDRGIAKCKRLGISEKEAPHKQLLELRARHRERLEQLLSLIAKKKKIREAAEERQDQASAAFTNDDQEEQRNPKSKRGRGGR